MRRWVLAVVGAAGACVPVATADSIWDRNDPRYGFLFQDTRARRVGDIMTVVVNETTVANEADARNLNRSTAASGSITFLGAGTAGGSTAGGGSATGGATGTVFNLPSNATSRSFTGSATMTANRVFTDRLAVTVVDIMPNGNLVVEGYRSRVVAGEERVLRITGVVRQQDVGFGSVVQSQSVANFRVSYLGRGPASRFTNQSLWGRAVNLVWP
jgi:flagellar L-ring protein precursor FlgH